MERKRRSSLSTLGFFEIEVILVLITCSNTFSMSPSWPMDLSLDLYSGIPSHLVCALCLEAMQRFLSVSVFDANT
jgi:hypothetical protein